MPPPTPFSGQKQPQEVTMEAAVGGAQQPSPQSDKGGPVMQIAGAATYNPPRKPPGEGGKKFTLQQLRATDAVVPSQSGTNQFASQQGMTGFGTPRNTNTPVYTTNPDLPPTVIPPEDPGKRIGRWTIGQLKAGEAMIRSQSGSNQFASQRGMAIGSSRDVRGKHLHRIWDGLYDEEIAAEKALLEAQQQQQNGPPPQQ